MFFAPNSISFPSALERALFKALWRGEIQPSLLAKRSQTLRSLWEKLAKGRGQAKEGETHYSFRREEADAYASYYLISNALKPALILEEAFLMGMDATEESAEWLDFGTGPGTAFWGLAWWFEQRKKKLHFRGWDQSPHFVQIGRDLAATRPFGASAEFQQAEKKEDFLSVVKKTNPTHVSFVNSIAEIFPEKKKRTDSIQRLVSHLESQSARDGQARYLLIVEPGSRESSRELAELKDSLEKASSEVLLPCQDNRKCGALADPKDWCHEEVACEFPDWLQELGSGAGLRKESMLFSYMLLQVGGKENFLRGRNRIVSQRLERKGQIECRICTAQGKEFVRVQRSKSTSDNEFLFQACRGDVWQDASWSEKGDLEKASVFRATVPTIF